MPVAIPPLFLERMSHLLGDEYSEFVKSLIAPPIQGLRVNTLKISSEEFRKISPFPLGPAVPWCDAAFIVDQQHEFGKHPYHKAGLFYLQDPSAMSAAQLLDPQKGECVLDLSAAPGGKTTHLASLMGGTGLLVANDIKTSRVGHLAMNVERWGAANVVVTNETPERLADHFGPFFERVLVDAPCSGEGMFRKEITARSDWSPAMVEGCSIRQRNILRVAARLVRPGGFLGYSTCTFAPEENEGVIDEFLKAMTDSTGRRLFEVVQYQTPKGFMHGRPDWISVDADPSIHGAVRLFPHRVSGEGHFVCILRRKDGPEIHSIKMGRSNPPAKMQMDLFKIFLENTLTENFPNERLQVFGERLYFVPEIMPGLSGLRLVHPGIWVGTFKKNRFEPAHPLALNVNSKQSRNSIHFPALDGDDVQKTLQGYLRGETIQSAGPDGWTLVCVDDYPIGWGKRVRGIVKNHYPHGWMM